MKRSVWMLLALTLGGCADNKGPCDANDGCEAGQVCVADACKTLCSADINCSSDEVCDDGVCGSGSRERPAITAVDGDGSIVCPDAGGTHCMALGLRIAGQNLTGAAFRLIAQGVEHELRVRAESTAEEALVSMGEVAPGNYVLTAVNNAGSADQAVTLLQGPPGEAYSPTPNELVQSINLATGTIEGARLGVHTHGVSDLSGVLPSTGGALSGELRGTDANFSGSVTVSGNVAMGPNGRLLPDGYSITNGVVHSDVFDALTHTAASKACAGQGAHLCRIAEWSTIQDADIALADQEVVWVDGIDSTGCGGVSCTTGLRMEGWRDGNGYTQIGPVVCADRCITALRYRCCL